jgi:hypothetical protein
MDKNTGKADAFAMAKAQTHGISVFLKTYQKHMLYISIAVLVIILLERIPVPGQPETYLQAYGINNPIGMPLSTIGIGPWLLAWTAVQGFAFLRHALMKRHVHDVTVTSFFSWPVLALTFCIATLQWLGVFAAFSQIESNGTQSYLQMAILVMSGLVGLSLYILSGKLLNQLWRGYGMWCLLVLLALSQTFAGFWTDIAYMIETQTSRLQILLSCFAILSAFALGTFLSYHDRHTKTGNPKLHFAILLFVAQCVQIISPLYFLTVNQLSFSDHASLRMLGTLQPGMHYMFISLLITLPCLTWFYAITTSKVPAIIFATATAALMVLIELNYTYGAVSWPRMSFVEIIVTCWLAQNVLGSWRDAKQTAKIQQSFSKTKVT